MPRVLIAIGSNLGDSHRATQLACRHLAECARGDEQQAKFQCSDFIVSSPVGGPPGQDDFLNGAAVFETDMSPSRLLQACRGIEQEAGRERKVRWSARTLDLDLLLWDDHVRRDDELELPHPRMTYRKFVMEPAVQIASDWVHPVIGLSLERIWERLRQPVGGCAIVSESLQIREQIASLLVAERKAMPDQTALPVEGSDWPADATSWLRFTSAAIEGAFSPPALTILCEPQSQYARRESLLSQVMRSAWRGPTLFLEPCVHAESVRTEVLAAVDAVW